MTALIKYVRQELAHLDTVSNHLILHGYLPWGNLPPFVAELPPRANSDYGTLDVKKEEPASPAPAPRDQY
jgi:hypothetical protein